jgi:hypothetical protein
MTKQNDSSQGSLFGAGELPAIKRTTQALPDRSTLEPLDQLSPDRMHALIKRHGANRNPIRRWFSALITRRKRV